MIIFLLLAFLLGSIPSGYIIGKLRGIDIRKSGSGNIGATNTARVLGKRAGIFTLVADILKGGLATALGCYVDASSNTSATALLGFCAILGHCFSPWLKFKGGKGVATALGAFLIISPLSALISLLVFATVTYFSRYVSLGSILAAAALSVAIGLIGHTEQLTILITVATSLLVIYRHKENIKRLAKGTENKLSSKS